MDIQRKGSAPTLCLVSGIHGDEFGVISSVEKALQTYSSKLPGYLWIPEISPSAVARKTRTNADDVDINRQFRTASSSAEAIAVMDELITYSFDLFISFHEDLELDDFYCYDSASEPPTGWRGFREELTRLGVPLLTGVDDPNDPTLGYQFTDGYLKNPPPKATEDGTLESWVVWKGIAKRCLNVETPGRLPTDMKDKIVDAFFRHLLLPDTASNISFQ